MTLPSTAEARAPSSSRGAGARRQPLRRVAALSGVRPDTLAPVLALGQRHARTGVMLALAGTLLVHGATAGKGLSVLVELALFSQRVRVAVAERLRSTYDVEMAPPPKAELPPPPEPEPEAKPLPRERANVAPPPPAEAGKVLTSEPTPDDGPVDLTGWGIVTGESDRFAGGTTTSQGTSKTAVRDRPGIQGGIPGGTGTAPAPPPKPAQDLSKPPGLPDGSWNNCGFPPEADMEQINFATVSIAVTVALDGSATAVNVLKDPGHGFGRLAQQCAMRKHYRAGLDASGKPVVKTVQFSVRFTR